MRRLARWFWRIFDPYACPDCGKRMRPMLMADLFPRAKDVLSPKEQRFLLDGCWRCDCMPRGKGVVIV